MRVATLALVALCPLALAQRQSESLSIPWHAGDLSSAREEARARNTPLMVFSLLDGEEESRRFRDALLKSRELLTRAEGSVLIVVNDGDHKQEAVVRTQADGSRLELQLCKFLGTRGCAPHQRNWDEVYLEYGASATRDGAWKLPEALILKPGGELHTRHNQGDPPPLNEVLAAAEKLARELGVGLSRNQWRGIEASVKAAENHLKAKEHGAAWRAFARTRALAQKGLPPAWAARIAPSEQAALEALRARLALLQPSLTADSIEESYPRLLDLIDECFETPLSPELLSVRRDLQKDPDLREAIRSIDREREAQGLLREARELLDAGEEARGKRILRRILSKKYAATPTAGRVRELYPDL